jgi:hydroxymethylpyrimidine/phosphomethylpyrimidine kinase
MPKVALTIGGSDSGGGAGIQADIKTFSVLGVHGTSAITAVTAQNTLGVNSVFGLPEEAVSAQLRSIAEDIPVDFAKTGMLLSEEIVSVVAEFFEETGSPLVVDPVMKAEAGGLLLQPDALRALRDDLIPLSRVVAPNIFEAEALSSVKVVDLASAELAARRIAEYGAEAVIIKGGHLDCTDLLLLDGEVELLKGQRILGGSHGVGCTYSAALTAFLARGCSLKEAARSAKGFAAEAIRHSMNIGRGAAPVNQSGLMREEAQRFSVLSEVDRAVDLLANEPYLFLLIPEVGSNIGMAIEGASSVQDVAAVEGRLVRAGNKVRQCGCVRFGASSHVARVILAAMPFSQGTRAAMNLSLEALELSRRMGLELASFDREEEPPGTETMSWGARKAIEELGRVPDVIWDPGGPGKEPMARLLGSSAIEVAKLAARMAKLLGDGKI